MKINFIPFLFAFCLCAVPTFAQDAADSSATEESAPEPNWKKGAILGLNFSQTYLDNWQGGGQNAINGTVILNGFLNYKKGKLSWENSFDAAYGLTRIGEKGQVQKTDDRVEVNSKLGVKSPVPNTFWTAMFTFRTQWDAGYDYSQTPPSLISDPFAPAYIISGLGIDYKPGDKFSAYISPITNKTTIVDNQRLADQGAFGVEGATYNDAGMKLTDGEMIRYEIGGMLKLSYVTELVKNVKLNTKADLFSNYLNNPQNIDINWETLIAMKINSWLTTSISTHVIYDDDITFAVDRDGDGVNDGRGPRTQLKEVFALGIQIQL